MISPSVRSIFVAPLRLPFYNLINPEFFFRRSHHLLRISN
ncbi:MAG: hypothetical protein ACI956_001841, partial [Nonlabens sp.]